MIKEFKAIVARVVEQRFMKCFRLEDELIDRYSVEWILGVGSLDVSPLATAKIPAVIHDVVVLEFLLSIQN